MTGNRDAPVTLPGATRGRPRQSEAASSTPQAGAGCKRRSGDARLTGCAAGRAWARQTADGGGGLAGGWAGVGAWCADGGGVLLTSLDSLADGGDLLARERGGEAQPAGQPGQVRPQPLRPLTPRLGPLRRPRGPGRGRRAAAAGAAGRLLSATIHTYNHPRRLRARRRLRPALCASTSLGGGGGGAWMGTRHQPG